MKLLASAILLLSLAAEPAHAAVVSAGKERPLPTIANLRAEDGRLSFDVKKAPATDGYDVWARLTNARGKKVAEWLAGSARFRSRSGSARSASFRTDVEQMLAYEKAGTYGLSVFVCRANVKKPNATACATASATVEGGR